MDERSDFPKNTTKVLQQGLKLHVWLIKSPFNIKLRLMLVFKQFLSCLYDNFQVNSITGRRPIVMKAKP